MVITGFFSNGSFEKRSQLSQSRISFCIPMTISSLIFPGTGCTTKIAGRQNLQRFCIPQKLILSYHISKYISFDIRRRSTTKRTERQNLQRFHIPQDSIYLIMCLSMQHHEHHLQYATISPTLPYPIQGNLFLNTSQYVVLRILFGFHRRYLILLIRLSMQYHELHLESKFHRRYIFIIMRLGIQYHEYDLDFIFHRRYLIFLIRLRYVVPRTLCGVRRCSITKRVRHQNL